MFLNVWLTLFFFLGSCDLTLCGSFLPLEITISLSEFLNSATGVYDLLDAREKRVTVRANLNTYIFLSRTYVIDRAACAGYCSIVVFRMDTGFHLNHLNQIINQNDYSIESIAPDAMSIKEAT